MNENLAALPDGARTLVEHLGLRLAFKLIQTWPGIKFRVPLGAREDGQMYIRLIETFGADDAAAIIAQFGGEFLCPPACAQVMRDLRDTRIIAEYSAGTSIAVLALRYRLGTRQIENILKRTPGAPATPRRRKAIVEEQGDLFGP